VRRFLAIIDGPHPERSAQRAVEGGRALARSVYALTLLAALLAPFAARADQPLRLRIGWVVVPGHLFPVVLHLRAPILRELDRDPDIRPDLAALQHNIDAPRRIGLLKAAVDVKSHADLSLIAAVAKRPR
jgi:hypothetical protein